MTCQQFLARYSEYLDEQLEPAEAIRWRQHTERCATCARYDRSLRRGLRLLQDLPAVEPSPDFSLRLQHRIALADAGLETDRRTPGGAAMVSLALAAVLAMIAWSPLLRRELERNGVGAGPRVEAGSSAASGTSFRIEVPARGSDGTATYANVPWNLDAYAPRPEWTSWWSVTNVASGTAFTPMYTLDVSRAGPHTPVIVLPPSYPVAATSLHGFE